MRMTKRQARELRKQIQLKRLADKIFDIGYGLPLIWLTFVYFLIAMAAVDKYYY